VSVFLCDGSCDGHFFILYIIISLYCLMSDKEGLTHTILYLPCLLVRRKKRQLYSEEDH
jgi:hypothetical protein